MNRIKKLRVEKKMKQSDLAGMLRVRQTTISNWENEVTEIDKESLFALADFFNVTTDYLLGKSNTPNLEAELDLGGANLYDLIQKGGYIIHEGEKHVFNDLNDENQKTLIRVFKGLVAEQNRKVEKNGG